MTLKKQNSQRYIYLADDDEDDRELFVEALGAVDPSVVLMQAEDGIQLMNILSSLSNPLPEILFLDINMPGKDGFECLEEIRKHEGSLKEIKVIIFSTSNDPWIIEKALDLGATFYAVKPNRFEVLKSFLDDVLRIDWEMAESKKKFRLL